MIVFSAITPHSPLLLPNIGKENLKLLKKTINAFSIIEKKLLQLKPDIIFIITPHSKSILKDFFTINITNPTTNNSYLCNFNEFGEFSTELEFSNEPGILMQLLEPQQNIPIIPTCDEILDNGVAIPLFYLLQNLKEIPIVPISISNLENEVHFEFGKFLQHIAVSSQKNIAVLASCELSHTLNNNAPFGFNLNGEIFDKTIQDILKTQNINEFLNIDKKIIKQAVSCGYLPLIILAGILDNINYKWNSISYEYPFGIGYLTGYFDIKND